MTTRSASVDLEEILAFTRVVQGQSFTSAAKALRLPKSTVSRKVAELEARVGARLLQRTTRTLSLTDVGRIYYEHCLRIVTDIEEAELAVARLQSTPRGVIRVTAPVAFNVLGPVVTEYLREFSDVRMELVCTDRNVDLVEERFDLAIRAGASPDSTLIARRLGSIRRRLVAAPEIAKRMRRAKGIDDLCGQPCIGFATEGGTWTLQSGSKTADVAVKPRLTVNDFDMLRTVARAGFGVALLPEFLCADDLRAGLLKPVLLPWTAPAVPVFALYPSTRHLSPKVVALLDLLQKRLHFEN